MSERKIIQVTSATYQKFAPDMKGVWILKQCVQVTALCDDGVVLVLDNDNYSWIKTRACPPPKPPKTEAELAAPRAQEEDENRTVGQARQKAALICS